jgi:hypothetical protein
MRTRPGTIGALHRRIAQYFDSTTNGQRDLNRSPTAFRQLAYHLDLAGHLLGCDVGLFDLVQDEAYRIAQRRALGGHAQCLADIRRAAAAAIRTNRLHELAQALADYASEDHLTRGGLARAARLIDENDGVGLVKLVDDLRRPDLGAALIAMSVARCAEQGTTPHVEVLAAYQASSELVGDSPWLQLGRSLRERIPVPEARSSGHLLVDTGGLERISPAHEWLPDTESTLERALRMSKLARMIDDLDGAVSDEAVREIAARLESAAAASLSDAERGVLGQALGIKARDAFRRAGISVTEAAFTLMEGTSSDYYNVLSQMVAMLVRLIDGSIGADVIRRRIIRFIAKHPERHFRGRTLGPLISALARDLEGGAPLNDALGEMRELLEIEAQASSNPTSDFVRFGIGRRAWTLGRHDVVHAVFGGMENHWVRGQLLRQAPLQALRHMDISCWLFEISNPLARAFALYRFIEARGDALEGEAAARVLSLALFEYEELTVSAIECLLTHWTAGPGRDARLAQIWSVLGHRIEKLDGNFAHRIVRALGAHQELPEAWAAWSHTHAVNAIEGVSVKHLSVRPDAILDGAWWAARLRSLALEDDRTWDGLTSEEARQLCARIGTSPPSVDTIAALLRIGQDADAFSTWDEEHQIAVRIARRELAPESVLADSGSSARVLEALAEWLAPTPEGDELVARHARAPALRRVILQREAEYREFDLGRTTRLVSGHGRKMLLVLVGWFFDASFSGPDGSRRPTAQRLCAEAMARFATDEEFDALVARWQPTDVAEVGHEA